MRRPQARGPTSTARRRVTVAAALIGSLAWVWAMTGRPGTRRLAAASPAPSGLTAAQGSGWDVGRAVPVPVAGGLAEFTVPTPGPGSRTLVIVSALARSAGPFPVRLDARPADPGAVSPLPSSSPTAPAFSPNRFPRAVPPTPALPPEADPVGGLPPRERTFHLLVLDGDAASASNYRAVAGRLRAVGHRVQVYVDARDAGSVGLDLLQDVVRTFDDRVFPVSARTLGQARDVDGDGRFTVLISGWLTRLAGGRHSVDGFVRGADLDTRLAAPFSNRCDMMYLSPALSPGPHLRTVLAHEYTHAVTFSAKTLPSPARPTAGGGVEEEGWLDEGIAHLVEDLHGFSRTNLDYRVSAFLSQPERYRLVVDDYYAADLFRSHGNRGGTYLFLRWCADRYGPEFLPTLVRSSRQGVSNVEGATGLPFAELFRAWTVALFATGFDPARPADSGYHGPGLRGPCDDWELAGPRTAAAAVGGPGLAWSSAGTAARFVVLGPSPTGAAAVTVTAPASAGLQVTALPLPADLADLELTVQADRPTGPGGVPSLRAALRERNGTPVRITSIGWEPLTPAADPRAAGFRHAALDALGVARAFGSSALPACGRLVTRPIDAADALRADGGAPLVVKAVGTDARGRRVAAWAEVSERPAPAEDPDRPLDP